MITLEKGSFDSREFYVNLLKQLDKEDIRPVLDDLEKSMSKIKKKFDAYVIVYQEEEDLATLLKKETKSTKFWYEHLLTNSKNAINLNYKKNIYFSKSENKFTVSPKMNDTVLIAELSLILHSGVSKLVGLNRSFFEFITGKMSKDEFENAVLKSVTTKLKNKLKKYQSIKSDFYNALALIVSGEALVEQFATSQLVDAWYISFTENQRSELIKDKKFRDFLKLKMKNNFFDKEVYALLKEEKDEKLADEILLNNLGYYLKDRYYSTIFSNYGDKNILKFVSDELFSNIFEIVYNFELNTTQKANHRDVYINSNIYHKEFDESISDLENIIIDDNATLDYLFKSNPLLFSKLIKEKDINFISTMNLPFGTYVSNIRDIQGCAHFITEQESFGYYPEMVIVKDSVNLDNLKNKLLTIFNNPDVFNITFENEDVDFNKIINKHLSLFVKESDVTIPPIMKQNMEFEPADGRYVQHLYSFYEI